MLSFSFFSSMHFIRLHFHIQVVSMVLCIQLTAAMMNRSNKQEIHLLTKQRSEISSEELGPGYHLLSPNCESVNRIREISTESTYEKVNYHNIPLIPTYSQHLAQSCSSSRNELLLYLSFL